MWFFERKYRNEITSIPPKIYKSSTYFFMQLKVDYRL